MHIETRHYLVKLVDHEEMPVLAIIRNQRVNYFFINIYI